MLHCVKAKRKVTCLHDDYDKCGANHQLNNVIMDQFDAIMPCSDGCRRVFESALPNLAYKTATVRNCNNITEIRTMAEMDSIAYDDSDINVLCAARFSPRKGIDRAIEAAYYMHEKGLPIKLHILGSGVMENELKEMARTRNMESYVTFYGEQANPYRFMKNADLFMLTSYHEAAPMVIDEAYILGVPVLTTRTNSSDEMVTDRVCGWVCENNQDSLNEMLYSIICDKHALREQKKELRMRQVDNAKAMEQFVEMIEG